MTPESSMLVAKVLALFFLTFVSEDAAVIGGALLALSGMVPWEWGATACFLGIWLGDLTLYGLARRYGRAILKLGFLRKATDPSRWERSEAWFAQRGLWALLISRFVPGMRLTTYLVAGLLRMSAWTFSIVTGVLGLIWVGLIFGLVHFLGSRATDWLARFHHWMPWIGGAFLLVLLTAWSVRRLRKNPRVRRWTQWEFWPAWLFYAPVFAHYLWLSLRYRSFTLPISSNPGIHTGGLVGESKYATLKILEEQSPDFTATTLWIGPGSVEERFSQIKVGCELAGLEFPFVLKPDFAQRGSGFKVVRSWQTAHEYLQQVSVPLVMQRYIPGPFEAGIFYYRFPGETSGRIFAITEKVFPELVGNGKATVEELIHADARASIIAETYLHRHTEIRDDVLAEGCTLRLVEAGNHAQGCIFYDGWSLWSEQLEARVDEISQKVPGFFIGRYDVRYDSVEALKRGEGFHILELNGAASEATNIYDPRTSLGEAYRILFRQWNLVFAIGAMNHRAGHRAMSLPAFLREWRKYQDVAGSYPPAD